MHVHSSTTYSLLLSCRLFIFDINQQADISVSAFYPIRGTFDAQMQGQHFLYTCSDTRDHAHTQEAVMFTYQDTIIVEQFPLAVKFNVNPTQKKVDRDKNQRLWLYNIIPVLNLCILYRTHRKV